MLTQMSGEPYKERRAIIQRSLTATASRSQGDHQEAEALTLIGSILGDPANFHDHIRLYVMNNCALAIYFTNFDIDLRVI